ncbi:hypothetical protein HYPSUDRAFT_58635, partial [Hypholoma sublateritium FD-334 SS-4]
PESEERRIAAPFTPLQPSFSIPLFDKASPADCNDNTSYLRATAQLKPVIEGKMFSTDIYNVSEDVFDLLQYLDGWERLRVTYYTSKELLSVKFPLFPHEIMNNITTVLLQTESATTASSLLPPAYQGGCSEVLLNDGTVKAPDQSLYDPVGLLAQVAYSESAKQLGIDCARWVLASNSNTMTAYGIDIESFGPTRRGIRGPLSKITVNRWTLLEFIGKDKNATNEQCGKLRRLDKYDDHSEEVVPLAKEYVYSLRMSKQRISTWWAIKKETVASSFQIYEKNHRTSETFEDTGSIVIVKSQIYRNAKETPYDEEVYGEVPYASIIHAVQEGLRRQVRADAKRRKAASGSISKAERRRNLEFSRAMSRKSRKLNPSSDAGSSLRRTRPEPQSDADDDDLKDFDSSSAAED